MKRWITNPVSSLKTLLQRDKSARNFPPAPEWHNKWTDPAWLERYLSSARREFYYEVIGMLPVQSVRLLDFGCGPGYFLRLLIDSKPSRASTHFVGIDISGAAAKVASQVCPEASIIHGSMYQVPLAKNSEDVIVCTEVLEHLLEPRRALDEMMRVLRPGGHVLVSVPDGDIDEWEGHNNFWGEAAFREFLRPYQFALERLNDGRSFTAILSK